MESRSRYGGSGTRWRSRTRAETMTGWMSRPTISGAASARDHSGWSRSRPRTRVVGLIAGWYVSGTRPDSSRTGGRATLTSGMRGRGASVGALALTIGVVLAGGIALRPVAPAQSAAILDTTPTEDATASVSVADPVAGASAPAVTGAEMRATPVARAAAVRWP